MTEDMSDETISLLTEQNDILKEIIKTMEDTQHLNKQTIESQASIIDSLKEQIDLHKAHADLKGKQADLNEEIACATKGCFTPKEPENEETERRIVKTYGVV